MMQKNLIFGDDRAAAEKITRIKKEGKDKIHAVLDFDRTLTPSCNQKGEDVSTWKLLNKRLPAKAGATVAALYEKYRPLEISGKMTSADALAWWSSVLNLYTDRNLKWLDLAIEVEETIPIRPGAKNFFDICGRKNIPTVIISAGIKDVIELWCQKFEINPTRILSTNLHFDAEGYVCGWDRDSLIHNFNKREKGHNEIGALRQARPNTILVGDNIEDAAMAAGDENVLRVFIEDPRAGEPREDNFYGRIFEKFDIIIQGGTLLPLADIVDSIN